MSRPRDRKKGNPDLRRRHNPPALEIPDLEENIRSLVEPCLFTPLKYLPGNHDHLMRDRLLTLPVLVALVVGIVYRQRAGLSEAVRVLNDEGLLSIALFKVLIYLARIPRRLRRYLKLCHGNRRFAGKSFSIPRPLAAG